MRAPPGEPRPARAPIHAGAPPPPAPRRPRPRRPPRNSVDAATTARPPAGRCVHRRSLHRDRRSSYASRRCRRLAAARGARRSATTPWAIDHADHSRRRTARAARIEAIDVRTAAPHGSSRQGSRDEQHPATTFATFLPWSRRAPRAWSPPRRFWQHRSWWSRFLAPCTLTRHHRGRTSASLDFAPSASTKMQPRSTAPAATAASATRVSQPPDSGSDADLFCWRSVCARRAPAYRSGDAAKPFDGVATIET